MFSPSPPLPSPSVFDDKSLNAIHLSGRIAEGWRRGGRGAENALERRSDILRTKRKIAINVYVLVQQRCYIITLISFASSLPIFSHYPHSVRHSGLFHLPLPPIIPNNTSFSSFESIPCARHGQTSHYFKRLQYVSIDSKNFPIF